MLLCLLSLAVPAHAQSLGVWLDASASTTQPPAGVSASDATYGLLGLRALAFLTDALSASARGQAGLGVRTEDGRWLFGEATAGYTRPFGPVQALLDASAFALRYDRPFHYDAGAVRLRPGVSAALGPLRLRVRADVLRGDWSSRYPETSEGPLPDPLPGVNRNGTLRIDGADAAVGTSAGAVALELEVGVRDAVNGTLDGRYTSAHLSASVPIDRVDLFGTVRFQDAVGEQELGAEVGGAIALGRRIQLIVLGTRGVTDPLYGTRPGSGVSVGASIRLGEWERTGRPGTVAIGAPAAGRRAVTLRVEQDDVRSVDVAGSFNAWTPVPLQRAEDGWSITLHLEPGTYTFAFRSADGTWFVPEDAPGVVDDGFGQKNATLVVPPL